MTVITKVSIKQRQWRGYDDPGLPVGMYWSADSVVGDATGGFQTVQFIFRAEANPLTGRFFNIEQYVVNKGGSDQSGVMKVSNFESVSPSGLINFERQIRLVANSPGDFDLSLSPDLSFSTPIFLGSPDALKDLEAQVNFRFVNVDTEQLVVSIQGYIWEARSVMSEGGLRRPADSLYGSR